MLAGAVHLDLVILWEADVEVGSTELMYLLDGAGSLLAKLVAGKVQYLQSGSLVLLVESLQLLVLWREAAARVAVLTMSSTFPL